MKAKQNLEVLDQFETLIITNPNCNQTIILAVKNGKFVMRTFVNEDATEDTLGKYTQDLSIIHRNIEFTKKIYILAGDGLDKTMLFSIEEMLGGLLFKPVQRKTLKQNPNLENQIKNVLDIVNSMRNEIIDESNSNENNLLK
ncbi:MAG: hypothetical protein IJ371_00630 [Clostridia bacterium]|nr:hypothetical protein [Clostridia bacterium]